MSKSSNLRSFSVCNSLPVRRAGAVATGCTLKMKVGTHDDDLRQNQIMGMRSFRVATFEVSLELTTCGAAQELASTFQHRYSIPTQFKGASVGASTDFVRSISSSTCNCILITLHYRRAMSRMVGTTHQRLALASNADRLACSVACIPSCFQYVLTFRVIEVILTENPILGIPSDSANHTAGFAKAARSIEAHEAVMLTMKGLALTAFRVLNDDVFWQKVRPYPYLTHFPSVIMCFDTDSIVPALLCTRVLCADTLGCIGTGRL